MLVLLFHVSHSQNIYSIASGDWNDGNTWSNSSGGGSCSCTPSSSSNVILESNFDVNMNVNGNALTLTINNGSSLIYTAANVNLNIKGAGTITVNSGGDILDNGQDNTAIDFDDANTCALICNDGTNGINVDDINVRAAGTLNISGTGDITVNDDFHMRGATTVNNNLTGTFTITDRLRFNAANATFNNNQTLTVSDDIEFESTGSVLTNAGTLNVTDDILLSTASCTATISGAGTLTVTDDINFTTSGTLTNNHTGTFSIDDIMYTASTATINNNQTLTVNDDIFLNNTLCVLANAGTVNVGSDIRMNGASASATFSGAGTIAATNDFRFTAASCTFTNNHTGSFTINDLDFDAASATFNNNQTLTINNQIQFSSTLSALVNASTINVAQDIITNVANATATISGAGNIIVTDDFLFNESANITNNLTGTFTVTDRCDFNNPNATFTNNQTISFGDHLRFESTGSSIVNAGTINLAADMIMNAASSSATISGAGNIIITDDFVFSTSGTFTNNMTGTFSMDDMDFNAASATFNNNETLTITDEIRFSSTSSILDNEGIINVTDDIKMDVASATATIQGAGDITITDDLLLSSNGNLTNNLTGTFTVSSKINFNSPDGTLTNNQTIGITDDIAFSSTGASLVNAGTLNIIDDILINAANATGTISGAGTIVVGDDFLFANAGTITNDLTGTFTIVDVLNFNVADARLNNNETIAVGDDIDFGSTGSILDNDGTINVSDEMRVTGANATVTLQGTGDINITNDLDFEATGTITNNMTGTIAVTDRFKFGAANSTFTNAGIVTVADLMEFRSTGGSYVNNGTTTITGNINMISNTEDGNSVTNGASDVLSFAQLDCNDADFNFYNNGTINQSGSFTDIVSASGFYNYAGSTWNFDGINTDADTKIYANYNSNTFNYSRDGDQDVITAEDNYWNLQFSGTSGTKTLTEDNLNVDGNLFIDGAAAFAAGSYNINVAGNWDNTSSDGDPFEEGTSTVILNGSSAQTINNGGTNDESYYNLTINATANTSLTASSDVTVTNTLTLTAGNIILGASNLILGTSASSSGGGNSSHIVNSGGGVFRKMWPSSGGNSFTWQLGSGSSLTPFTITLTAASFGATPYIDASVTGSIEPNLSSPTDYIARYWTATPSDITSPLYNFSGTYLSADVNGTETNCLTQKYDGSWEEFGAVDHTNNIISGAAVTSFSNYTGAQTEVALPVELISFSVNKTELGKLIEWTTASEINNDYFELRRSIDGINFETIAVISGAGSTEEITNYEFIDKDGINGKVYYQLIQFDFDGTTNYSDVISIFSETKTSTASIFPNPNTGNELFINSGTENGLNYSVAIYDLNGKTVYSNSYSTSMSTISLEDQDFTTGVYSLIISNPTSRTSIKLVIK